MNIVKIQNRDLHFEQLVTICNLKASRWDYSLTSQLEWIGKYIKKKDLHLPLYDEDKLQAYVSLIDIRVEIDGLIVKGYGVSSLCSAVPEKLYGFYLMQYCTKMICEENRIGFGFCKNEKLITLYQKLGWITVTEGRIKLPYECDQQVIYLGPEFKILKYDGWRL